MNIQIGESEFEFRPWRLQDGKVFDHAFAFDTETTAIDRERPWLTPAYVLGGAFDGRVGYFVLRDRVQDFLNVHHQVPMILHHAAFDLDVLHLVAPDSQVYDRVEDDRVYDTQLMARLYALGTDGHTASGSGESTLDHCAELYLGVMLPKDVKDAAGRDVRVSFDRWLNRPPAEIEELYLEYLAKDVIITYQLFHELRLRLDQMLLSAERTWGFVSPAWLAEQKQRWGWQTHHIQLRASIVLRAITANGLTLDMDGQRQLADHLTQELCRLRKVLADFGYTPGQKGASKALQFILRQVEAQHHGPRFPRTPTGKYATSYEALGELSAQVPFLQVLFDYAEIQKLLSCFVGKMKKPVIHPSFNVLARTGRTTSHGEINAQNLPRNDAVRGCFVPSPGHVFVKADYATIELATLGQALLTQFGLHSEMAAAINAGKDLHRLVAAHVTRKPEIDVTDEERQQAKPINFGKPGAMGNASLKQYAKASYGVTLGEEEVRALSDAWLGLFPEMAEYLRPENDLGQEVARFFELTPDSHYEQTGCRKFVNHPANEGCTEQPHPILGAMLLKVLKNAEPVTGVGVPYHHADIDYFWTRVEHRQAILPANLQDQVRNRIASPSLQRAVRSLVGRAPVFTLTGRLRANATFAARRNTIFQGLAADGAKLALWNLWRAGYRLVNFVHDEVLIEVRKEEDLRLHADRIRQLMIAGMKAVVPDVRVEVEYAACARWYKKAKPVIAPDGGLELWQPPISKPDHHC